MNLRMTTHPMYEPLFNIWCKPEGRGSYRKLLRQVVVGLIGVLKVLCWVVHIDFYGFHGVRSDRSLGRVHVHQYPGVSAN